MWPDNRVEVVNPSSKEKYNNILEVGSGERNWIWQLGFAVRDVHRILFPVDAFVHGQCKDVLSRMVYRFFS